MIASCSPASSYQPFTAPAISAPMMNRCSTRKTTTAGTMEMTLAAARICVEVWL
jgi:hypothetical protein